MARTSAAVVKLKQIRALELLTAGRSYDQIAEELGYTNRAAAWRLIAKALDGQVREHAQLYLRVTLARLEAILGSWWHAATTGQDHRAALIVLKVIEMQSKLLGLDATSKTRSRSEPQLTSKPRGIVLRPDELDEWRAAGSPQPWNRT